MVLAVALFLSDIWLGGWKMKFLFTKISLSAYVEHFFSCLCARLKAGWHTVARWLMQYWNLVERQILRMRRITQLDCVLHSCYCFCCWVLTLLFFFVFWIFCKYFQLFFPLLFVFFLSKCKTFKKYHLIYVCENALQFKTKIKNEQQKRFRSCRSISVTAFLHQR